MERWTPGYPVDCRTELQRSAAAGSPFGDVEYRAARIIGRATGLRVLLSDDNSNDAMPDLTLMRDNAVVGVAEVVTDTDPAHAGVVRAFANGALDFEDPRLVGRWWLGLSGRARRKSLGADVVPILIRLEASRAVPRGLTSTDGFPSGTDMDSLRRLGVTEAGCALEKPLTPGKVSVHPEGIGGANAVDPQAFDQWIAQFLTSDLAKSKLSKLRKSDYEQSHLFVGSTSNSKWDVHLALSRESGYWVPTRSIALPQPLTHLWLYDVEFVGRCLMYDRESGWRDVERHWVTA